MKSVIYYFTGTGNTLAIARALAAELGDTKLIPLRRTISPLGISTDADAVGIAFPVYFLDMPALVRQFVRQIRFSSGNPYIFGIATCGERPGGAPTRCEIYHERRTGKIVGAQLLGESNLKRIDLVALAMRENIPLARFEELDFAYAPDVCSARDPLYLSARDAAERERQKRR